MAHSPTAHTAAAAVTSATRESFMEDLRGGEVREKAGDSSFRMIDVFCFRRVAVCAATPAVHARLRPAPCPHFRSVRRCRQILPPGRDTTVKRRDLLKLGGLALAQGAAARLPARAETSPQLVPAPVWPCLRPRRRLSHADYTLRIAPVTVELDPTHILSTIGYNGTAPGPVLRMKEGKPVTVDDHQRHRHPRAGALARHVHSAR